MPKKPSRPLCAICKRRRPGRFVEWAPGTMQWQCKEKFWKDCNDALVEYEERMKAAK